MTDHGHGGCCGCNPTLLALEFKDPEMVDLFISNGFSLSGEICTAGSYPGASALHLALRDDSLTDALRRVLSRSDPEDFHTGHAIHPLHFAVERSNHTGLLCLIRHYLGFGIKPFPANYEINNHSSVSSEISDFLGKIPDGAPGSDVLDSNQPQSILNIAINPKKSRGPYILQRDVTADLLDGYTPLHIASRNDNEDAARLLTRVGVTIDSQSKNGSTPLHIAASRGSISVLKHLLACGANPRSRDRSNMTPAMSAVYEGQMEVLVQLENHGVDITQPTRTDQNLLNLALQSSSAPMLAYLLQKSCPSTKDIFGNLPLAGLWRSNIQTRCLALNSTMATTGDSDHIERLGADQLIEDGQTSLLKKLFKRLSHQSRCRANISSQSDPAKMTPLCKGAVAGQVGAMALLIDFGAHIEVESWGRGTPLMAACAAGRLCAVEFLVRHGARETYVNNERSFSALEEAKHFSGIRRWLLVDRYTQQRKIGNGSEGGSESDGRGFWAGLKTFEVPLTRQWGRFGDESTLDHLRRLSIRKRELEGEVLCWPEGAEHPFVRFS